MYNLAKTDKTKHKIKIIMKLNFNLIEQLRKRFPPAASPAASPSPLSHQSKKTNPLFDPQGASRF